MIQDKVLIRLDITTMSNIKEELDIDNKLFFKLDNIFFNKDGVAVSTNKLKNILTLNDNIINICFYKDKYIICTDAGVYSYDFNIINLLLKKDITFCYFEIINEELYIAIDSGIFILTPNFTFRQYESFRNFLELPPGILCYYKGILYSCVSNYIFFSNPLNYLYMDKSYNYILMESEIIDMKSLDTLLVISCSSGVFILSGDSPNDFKLKKISENKLKSKLVKTNLSLQKDKIYSDAIVFCDTDGIFCILGDNTFVNLTKEYFNFYKKDGTIDSIGVKNRTLYINYIEGN